MPANELVMRSRPGEAEPPGQVRMSGNLFAGLPVGPQAAEQLEALLVRPGVRIERIVSSGQASPAGFWYEQAEAEWVLLASGAALLRFEDEAEARRLAAGDWLYIEPRRRHRVEWTATDAPSVWLAVHLPADIIG